MKKERMKVIHDNDLEQVLKDLGIYEDIVAQRKKCKFCEHIIDLDNLQGLFPESGDIKFCCDTPECLEKAYVFLNKDEDDA